MTLSDLPDHTGKQRLDWSRTPEFCATSALPMEFPQNFHARSAHKVRNDIHKLKHLAA
jgi:hypothetical protein